MRVTPLDIQHKQFAARYKGFHRDEVNEFLRLLADEMAELLKENASLREGAKKIENQLQEYDELEMALRDTIMRTHEYVATHSENAIKEAERLKKEAAQEVEEMVGEEQRRLAAIHKEITDLKSLRKHFREEMKKLIDSNLGKIESSHGYSF